MAVRIRADGTIVCAAMHGPEEGDAYVDDGLHYHLSVELKTLVTERMERHKRNGLWWWKDQVPAGCSIDPFYLE